MTISIILAHDNDYGIGKDGYVPWNCPEDMRMFKQMTTGKTLIIGKNTWNQMGDIIRRRIHIERRIIVISRTPDEVCIPHVMKNFIICDGYESAVETALTYEEDIFIVGGSMVYEQALEDERVKNCLVTHINGTFNCDVYVKFLREHLRKNWKTTTNIYLDNDDSVLFTIYIREHQENQYINILKDIMMSGVDLPDRTGVGIKSVFGRHMRFDCSKRFPLLTTKKMFVKGIVEELLWFIKGSTDSIELEDKGVKIWKGNTSREYLDSIGFHDRQEGDIGPGYGHQWRFWNAPYTDCKADYTGKGIDQLKNCIDSILKEKSKGVHDRRNLMIAWNPGQIDEMSLPPCHILVQFYLCGNDLSLQMYQRSADMFLGVPFNIASYALLLNMVAAHTDCFPKDLIMSFGDCHIYSNHLDAVDLQLSNYPKTFPVLKLRKSNIFEIESSDIVFEGYESHGPIKAPMAV